MLCHCACRSTSGGAAALATRLRAAFSTASPYRLALRPKVELPAPQHFISGSDSGNVLSPWHQIPLFVPSDPAAAASAAPSAYMVATVARHSTNAQRLSLTLPFNPLVQERTAAGGERSFGLRTLAAMGELPQTYDSAEVVDPLTGVRGSGAPLAVVDIGRGPREVGTVGSVRVLGALPLIEGGVSAWKVLAVSDSDPLAASLACITSPSAPPAVLKLAQDLAQWFQLVGVTEGGKGATIKGTGQGGSSPWLGSAAALALLRRSHEQWKQLQASRPTGGMYASAEGARSGSQRPWVAPAAL